MNIKIWIPLLATAGAVACAVQPQYRTENPTNRVDEILTALQQRSEDLKDIRTRLRFVEDDRINLTQRTKIGSLMFKTADPNPLFFIDFDKTEVDGILGRREWYLFDGRWLHEASERLQQVTKREIARPGETINLFDLENAPFPLPFGQKKKTILRNFNVILVPPAPGDPPDTDHLMCTPRPESKFYDRYDKLEFYIHHQFHLPVKIVMTKNEGLEVNTAEFPGLSEKSINTGLQVKDFRPPRDWKKYEVVEEKLD